jgi:hypothetical protein
MLNSTSVIYVLRARIFRKEVGNLSSQGFSHQRREGILSAVSAGVFFVLIGSLFIIHPNLYDNLVSFFSDFKVAAAFGTNNIMLPIPINVASHVSVYTAAEQFSLAWGVFLVAAIVVRFAVNTSTRRKAQNISDIIFWFGTAYLIQTWLIDQAKWFEFWALTIILVGISLVGRAIYLALASATRHQNVKTQ